MKVKRYKKAQRYISFYRNHFGFRAPYQILLDGTFCQAALKNKVNLAEQIPKYLSDEVKLLTTVCVVTETEKLGPALYGAALIVKQFPVIRCGHEKKPISAIKCLHDVMTKNSNSDHFILATQDYTLSNDIRSLPGCPLLYMKLNAINFEKPSEVSEGKAKADAVAVVTPLDHEVEALKALKRTELGETDEPRKPKKRKGPKGPNPLSVKKKKKGGPAKTSDTGKTSSPKKNRKRNKKIMLPKAMSQLLDAK